MLFRLVRPMKRAGSRNQYFVKRIPSDLKSRGGDLHVYVPLGDEAISLHRVTPLKHCAARA